MKKKSKFILPGFLLALIITLLTLFLIITIKDAMIPSKYLIIATAIIFIISAILITTIIKTNNKIVKTIMTFLILIISTIIVFGIKYNHYALDFTKRITNKNYQTENYSLIVLKESSDNLEDYKDKMIGVLASSEESSEKAVTVLNKRIKFSHKSCQTLGNIASDLVLGEISAMLMESSYLNILEETNPSVLEKVKVIWTDSIEISIPSINKDKDVTLEPFIAYISGIDTYGPITTVSRSDVNMIVVVNPKSYDILLVSIPRDYYVPIYGYATKTKDKLTHTGIKGINNTIKTIENFFEIDINYYLKVNFNTLVKMVDLLDGIEVYSDYDFTANNFFRYRFKKGWNYLNGDQALVFSRERHSFIDGDNQRIKDQQKVMEGIIRKLSSPAVITKYSKILDTLANSFVTNMQEQEIKSFINFQLDKLPSWKVQSITVEGDGLMTYGTPYYPNMQLYVSVPIMETVNTAKLKIEEIKRR